MINEFVLTNKRQIFYEIYKISIFSKKAGQSYFTKILVAKTLSITSEGPFTIISIGSRNCITFFS